MPRGVLIQNSFVGGVASPKALGRSDLARYQQSLGSALNMVVEPLGGVKRRSGTMYHTTALSATADRSRIVPFKTGRLAWLVEFANLTCRILDPSGTVVVASLAAPYSDTQLTELDWAQSDSTMWLFHPLWPVQRLQRLSDGSWALSPAPFTQVPFVERGTDNTPFGTLSATTVGTGRTLSTSANIFLAADVGRPVTAGAGIAVITSVSGGPTLATIEITRAFAGVSLSSWVLGGSPQTTLTPSGTGPVGTSITLMLSAAGWRAEDVGKMVRVNGGLAKITVYTDTLTVTAVVQRELAFTTAAPALSWSLEAPAWYGNKWPRTGTIHQQRLICAGTSLYPRTIWGSRIGEPLDFELWTNDSDAFAFTIDSDESSPIAYVSSSRDLMVLTESAEYSMRNGVEKGLTPSNVRVVPESNHGSAAVRPVTLKSEVVFVQRAGRKVRSLGYRYDFDEYSSPDLTQWAEHLTRVGVKWMTWQQEPDSIMWMGLQDGTLVACTIDRDQQPAVVAMMPCDVGGFCEWGEVIPTTDRDELWMIVRRVINGSTVRYLERMDDTFTPFHPTVRTVPAYRCQVDCGVLVDNASGQTVFTGLGHLEGKQVDVVGDGAKLLRRTVASGQITIERASKRTLIGLPFASHAALLRPEIATPEGTIQGQPQRTGKMVVRLYESAGGVVEGVHGDLEPIPTRKFGAAVLNGPPELATQEFTVTMQGWERGDYAITLRQTDPMPFHVLSVVRTHTSNA